MVGSKPVAVRTWARWTLAPHHLLIAAALPLTGCFPEFTSWLEGHGATSDAATTAGTGGATSSSSASTGGSGGAGGASPTCEALGGLCAPTARGYIGPATRSVAPCDEMKEVLRIGSKAANTQTETCHFTAKPDACSHAQLLVSTWGACEPYFGISAYPFTPEMNACATNPPNGYTTFDIHYPSHAPCVPIDPQPLLSYENEEHLCQGAGTCPAGNECVFEKPNTKVCVWLEEDGAECPPDYPDPLYGLKTATATCTPATDATCVPKLLFAPNCMLLEDETTVIGLDQAAPCSPLPDSAVWALDPGTVGTCDDQTVSHSNERPVTLCCTVASP